MKNKISFIISNYNTKKYTEWSYNSIRKNLSNDNEIVLLDDGSNDGTWELLLELKKKDSNLIIYRNEFNMGIPYSYNKMVDLSKNEIVCMLHSDMYVPKRFDEIILNYFPEYDFITLLRVEPNVGYPPSVDKLIIDLGKSSESFKENEFLEWNKKNNIENKGRVEKRMFFPWAIKKTLYNKIGGNDLLFSKYMVDDDDFYIRIKMSGANYCQLFETAVYHTPSKSVRMREDKVKNFSDQYNKSIRNFIRKWGCHPNSVWHRKTNDILIPEKFDVGFVVNNCNYKLLQLFEPWTSQIYVEDNDLILKYIKEEQEKTIFNLKNRVKKRKNILKHNIIIEFDALKIKDKKQLIFLENFSKYLKTYSKTGEFFYDIYTVKINSLDCIKNISFLPFDQSKQKIN